ncbi:MAG: response regulator transcription factor [Clostridia bacterium]|nr:response regulator transcription factor [Clostridia bacterium]
MYRIFLVEDDFSLASELQKQLERSGYQTRVVSDFRAVHKEVREYDPHLILMDIMLPYQNGYYWTAEIRKSSSVPVVFLSSASDGMNIVMAVNMGGDDFIPKPVEPMVLCAKVQAVLRRSYELNGGTATVDFCGAVLNLNDSTVTLGEEKTELTKNELRILSTLLENRGKIVSRDALMLRLWNDDCYVEENTLTVNVTRLRHKLESLGLQDIIITKPGRGYLIS